MTSSGVLAGLFLVICVYSSSAYVFKRAVCANTELSDTLRNQILSFHNDARRRVAKGQEPNNVGTLNPAKKHV
ncbi:hypothetical protein OSTOST_24869 [Ostertagia ostertagi]